MAALWFAPQGRIACPRLLTEFWFYSQHYSPVGHDQSYWKLRRRSLRCITLILSCRDSLSVLMHHHLMEISFEKIWQIYIVITPSGRTQDEAFCGRFLCSLLSMSFWAQLNHVEPVASDNMCSSWSRWKDGHFVSGNHAFAGHWWCHMGRGKL